MKTESRLNTLKHHLDTWVQRTNLQHVAMCVLDTVNELHLQDMLKDEDITLKQTLDPTNDARINAQKISRWMGANEKGTPNYERLFAMEQVFVAAMPSDIRVSYLNEVYSPASVAISCQVETKNHSVDLSNVVKNMIKEDTDVHLAMLELGQNTNVIQLQKARKELNEAISIKVNTLKAIETELEKIA